MALNKATIAWHLGSMAAGGVAVINAAASHKIDLYTIFDQMQKVYGDLVTLGAMLLPVAALAAAAYRTYGMKNVPSAAVAIEPRIRPAPTDGSITDPKAIGNIASVTGKIVGALLLALIVFAPGQSFAQQSVAILQPAPNSCDPAIIFNLKTPDIRGFIARLKTCNGDDLKAAVDDAGSAPLDNAALACLVPVQKFIAALGKSGLVSDFQAFRRAKQSGVITSCTNYVNSTILFQ